MTRNPLSRRTHLAWSLALAMGCAAGEIPESEQSGVEARCRLTSARYPTTREDFTRLYNGRGFYTDGNHLGRDIAYSEGTAIHPLGCGVVRVYRAASGYGTLVAVVEHHLETPRTVVNGLGVSVTVRDFMSIYGHLRATSLRGGGTSLGWHAGDTVGPEDVIGYIQNDADNGDGAEHLHLGIRLQTMTAAATTDTSWFRGYDTVPSQRSHFADPANFLPALLTDLSLGETTVSVADAATRDTGSLSDAPLELSTLVGVRDAGSALLDAGRDTSRTPDVMVTLDVAQSVDVRMSSDVWTVDSRDAGSVSDVGTSVTDARVTPLRESCNGLDDDGNGQTDEIFLCPLGRVGPNCITTCGAIGYRVCALPRCDWSEDCRTFKEACANGADDDCDGRFDCADDDCRSAPECRPSLDAGSVSVSDAGSGVDVSSDVTTSSVTDVMSAPDVATDSGERITDVTVWTPDVPVSEPFERVIVLPPETCDGRALTLADHPGMTWYHLCATTPQFGLTSSHPFSLDRPTALEFAQFWDFTLPVFTTPASAPSGSGVWRASVAIAVLNSPIVYPFFNARLTYGAGRQLYAVGQNRSGGPLELNGELNVWTVRDGRQTLADTEIVGGVGCHPSDGGSLHVRGTGCPLEVCQLGTWRCTD